MQTEWCGRALYHYELPKQLRQVGFQPRPHLHTTFQKPFLRESYFKKSAGTESTNLARLGAEAWTLIIIRELLALVAGHLNQ
jgi:hypothetical protein